MTNLKGKLRIIKQGEPVRIPIDIMKRIRDKARTEERTILATIHRLLEFALRRKI